MMIPVRNKARSGFPSATGGRVGGLLFFFATRAASGPIGRVSTYLIETVGLENICVGAQLNKRNPCWCMSRSHVTANKYIVVSRSSGHKENILQSVSARTAAPVRPGTCAAHWLPGGKRKP